jgi:RHS repeat-associated protein
VPLPVVLQSKTGANAMQYVYALGTRPLAQNSGAWEYLLADARPCPTLQRSVGGPLGVGSVRQIAAANGNVTLAESYEPYGSVLMSSGTASSIFAYAGEQIDTYIKLLFLRARYYSPDTARFLSKDVWQGDYTRPQSLNAWAYVENSPINYTDPSGYCLLGASDYVECMTTRNEINQHFNARVYIDVPQSCPSDIPGLPMPWTAAELNILREGLYSLEKFWTPSSFPYLFTPIAIRRVGIGSVGSAALRIADPYHLHSMPVIELDNNTFGNPSDTNNVIGVLWGEMYHYMDYILSDRPAIWSDSSDQQANTQLMYDVCFSQSTHSSRFASAAGWNIFQCQATFGVGILKDTNLIINSPANLVEGSGNYAAKGVHEDFAHTYQVLTQALIWTLSIKILLTGITQHFCEAF